MAKPTISQIRECIRSLNYVVSIHAAEELDDDNLTIDDLENIILTGKIIECQRDTRTQEIKCVSSVASRSKNEMPKSSSKSGLSATSSSLPPTSPSQLCASCGQPGVRLRNVTRGFGRGPLLLVIEDIPLWTCPHCGESYLTAQTLHEIERIKALRKSVAVERPIPVAMFQVSCN